MNLFKNGIIGLLSPINTVMLLSIYTYMYMEIVLCVYVFVYRSLHISLYYINNNFKKLNYYYKDYIRTSLWVYNSLHSCNKNELLSIVMLL